MKIFNLEAYLRYRLWRIFAAADGLEGYKTDTPERRRSDPCYDMEVGEDRVYRIRYREKEKERDSRYIQEASAPVTASCIRPSYICNNPYVAI